MKLSMWMIANLLYDFELEVRIQEQSPANLRSARRVYAANCAYVYGHGNDSICQSGDDQIVIKDIGVQEAIEIVQSIFDFYEDWDYAIKDAIKKRDFQKVIDRSWHIFRNPMVIQNANWNVVAICSRYGKDDIDSEWKHLYEYGYSSLEVYSFLRNDIKNNYNADGARFFKINNPKMSDCLSSRIMYNNDLCGRINVIEKDRELNSGDVQLLNYLVGLLSEPMGTMNQNMKKSHFSVFQNLIQGKGVDDSQLIQQMKYMGWNDGSDSFYILLISPQSKSLSEDYLVLLMNHLFRLFYNCVFLVHKHGVVAIVNKKDMTDNFINDIKKIIKNRNYIIGKSLPFQNIRNSKYFYDQVKFVIDRNIDSPDIVKEGKIIDFYDYAIEYIIRNSDENAAFFACNPDIVKLWYMDKTNNLDRLKTFSVYLNNDRSLLYAAQELYVHRNTLVYRINKILEELSGDLDDVYTRDYMKLSIRILNIYNYSEK